MAFNSIIGQDRAIRLLRRALAGGRLAHAYLFLGPEGVGKMLTARELAGALLCPEAQPDKGPCGRCRSCALMAAGSHPDFLHVLPDGASIKIKQIRNLKEQLSFAPLEGARRAVVIEEAQCLGREAANSLLKLLEEPLPGNILLLVAADSPVMLPTIVSRCQVIPFIALSREQTAAVVRKQGLVGDTGKAEDLALLADGSPGRAVALGQSAILPLFQEITNALGSQQSSRGRTVEDALELAGRIAEERDQLPLLFELLATYCKEQLVLALGPRAGSNAGQGENTREGWNLAALSAKVEAINRAETALKHNCSRTLVCETLLLALLVP